MLPTNKTTMTSLEIAEFTGKLHKNLMRDIRDMEASWEKVNRLKFELVDYADAKGEKRPMYLLSKEECLYIATKFNDEVRAKLIMRWKELETAATQPKLNDDDTIMAALLILQQRNKEKDKLIEEQKPKVQYHDEVLNSDSLFSTETMAKTMGMTANKLYKLLHKRKIIFPRGGVWKLYRDYDGLGYVGYVDVPFRKSGGGIGTKLQMKWTEKGHKFLYETIKGQLSFE